MTKNSYLISENVLLMPSASGCTYFCEQLCSLMKNIKSRTRIFLIYEHLEGCMQIITTEIKLETERLLKQKQYRIITLMIAFIKENY
jgi:hypothetical protein